MNYYELKIGSHELKCRLGAREVRNLEKKLGGNPLNVLMAAKEGGMPEITGLLAIVHASLQKLEHGWTEDKVFDLYDELVDEGGDVTNLLQFVMEIFQFSGLLPKEVNNEGE